MLFKLNEVFNMLDGDFFGIIVLFDVLYWIFIVLFNKLFIVIFVLVNLILFSDIIWNFCNFSGKV